MQDVFGAEYASLHVRVTNRAAKHLYTQSLGYRCARRPRALLSCCLLFSAGRHHYGPSEGAYQYR